VLIWRQGSSGTIPVRALNWWPSWIWRDSQPKLLCRPLSSNRYWKRNFSISLKRLSECLGTPLTQFMFVVVYVQCGHVTWSRDCPHVRCFVIVVVVVSASLLSQIGQFVDSLGNSVTLSASLSSGIT